MIVLNQQPVFAATIYESSEQCLMLLKIGAAEDNNGILASVIDLNNRVTARVRLDH